jgi:hypothetical protein
MIGDYLKRDYFHRFPSTTPSSPDLDSISIARSAVNHTSHGLAKL